MTSTREPAGRSPDRPGPSRLRFGLLGPLSVTRDGVEVRLGGRRQRAVLAVLLLARGHQVGTDRLLDALWDGAPPAGGPAGLQSYVSHLRRALEPDRAARTPSRVLVSRGAGYAMPVPDDDVDAWRFTGLVEQAVATPDPAARTRLLREALDLWRGPALAEYVGADWADVEARRLDELREVAREVLVAARLDLGESAVVVPELETLLAAHPLREERWRLLALALYRSHRQADALATLRRARRTLAEELGVDPGPALRALEADVLAQSPTLDGPRTGRVAPAAPAGDGGALDVTARPPVPEQRGPGPAPGLVERDAELAALRGCLADVAAGRPRVALVEGPAGIGKTSLLQQVVAEARAAGTTVLTARGSPLEKEFGFGAVPQLLEPVLAGQRDGLLSGGAAAAGAVFDLPAAGPAAAGDSLFSVLHGLYWMVGHLAARAPVVLAVDDVQWCDAASLRFLGYLSRRLDGLPVLLVATVRTGESSTDLADGDLVGELGADPETIVVRPRPLTAAGTSTLVRSRLGATDTAFATACFRTTSGNPLLLRQLLRALESEGVRPDASHADTVRAIGSRAVSSLVLIRFRRMPETHRTVARAVAVLGDRATLPLVSAMTGLDDATTATALAALARSEVLGPDQPLGFVHPLVEAAVYDDLSVGERELQHERAAHVLAASGAAPEQVAAHLLLVPPRGDGEVVETLRAAAQRAVERGATESATTYLRRALAEPPAPADEPALLMDLGRLETLTDGEAALEHLTRAYRLLDDPRARAETAIMLARTAVFAGPRGQATRIARAAAAALPSAAGPEDGLQGGLQDERQALVALGRIGGFMHGLDPADYLDEEPPAVTGDGPGARGLAALLAWELLCRGECRDRARELARFAVADRVLQQHDPGLLWVVAANVLFLAGEDTGDFWEQELQFAYRTGSLFAALATHLWLGFVQWHQGDLRAGLQSMVQGTEQTHVWSAHGVGQMYLEPFSVHLLLDRGHVAQARQVLELARHTRRIGDTERLFLEAEVRLLLDEGRAEESLAVLDRAEPLMTIVVNPVWRPQRWLRARTLHALGRDDEALRLLDEELALARRWGTAGLVGRTLLLRGRVEAAHDRAAARRTLREALRLLEGSERRLDVGWAAYSLAGVLDGPQEVVPLLEQALDVAETCGADGLRTLSARRLRALGRAVPEEPAPSTRLTPTERRVAAMAADGATAEQIAIAYLMTTSTVTAMLDAVCERLGVSGPDELADALLLT